MSLIEILRNQKERETEASRSEVLDVLACARELHGISADQALTLLGIQDDDLVEELFETARYAKEQIYGKRIVLFAPLYVSNYCSNDCVYCAFRTSNKDYVRTQLEMPDIEREVECLINQGHKRLLLVAGEKSGKNALDYVIEAVETAYSVKTEKGNIRRINVNIAPLEVDDFKRLFKSDIGTFQSFQETYNEEMYKKLHLRGPKSDYNYRVTTMDRAFQGGGHDVGMGVLFGLAPWKQEVASLLKHAEYLDKKYGVGPHTLSVPRIEPAEGSDYSNNPTYPVSDHDFLKIIAVLRLAVPYTGIILSTRESAEVRKKCLDLGVSQISAGSKTNPGGYNEAEEAVAQFTVGDSRSLLEVIKDVVESGYIPSFCTGCYRKGRVGKDFMDLAKPGLIKKHCLTNALSTFYEYLVDFSDDELMQSGRKLMSKMVDEDVVGDNMRKYVADVFERIEQGERDVYL
jgi:2-iminoacetate synthase